MSGAVFLVLLAFVLWVRRKRRKGASWWFTEAEKKQGKRGRQNQGGHLRHRYLLGGQAWRHR